MAHSVTMTPAALGVVHLPSGIVEPVIAANIVLVAIQNVVSPEQARGRSRVVLAFAFGLFHELGFASGLVAVRHELPTTTVLLALLGFSLGVELGNQFVIVPLFTALKWAQRAMVPSHQMTRVRHYGSLTGHGEQRGTARPKPSFSAT